VVSGSPASGNPANGGLNLCWSYDAFGNRTAQAAQSGTCPAGGPAFPTAAYNTNNQVTFVQNTAPMGYAYDASGDVTSDNTNTYLYDAEGRICAVRSEPVAGTYTMTGYLYDANGTRVAKGTITNWSCDPATSGFSTTNDYILGQGGEQMTEMTMNGDGSALVWEHTNVWAGGKIIATYSQDNTGSQTQNSALHFYLDDPLGSRRVQTDYAGVVEKTCQSLPFGDGETCLATPTEHLFTGKERDSESGNDYFGARYYASSMGRWMSPDPINLTNERLMNPTNTLNKYAYGANNPLKYIDKDGKDITIFYRPSSGAGDFGHIVVVALNQETGANASMSFVPTGNELHSPGSFAQGDSNFRALGASGVDKTYASLTIQTNPDEANHLIDIINKIKDGSQDFSGLTHNCTTVCEDALHDLGLDFGVNTPEQFWHDASMKYSPETQDNPFRYWYSPSVRGHDYGSPRNMGMSYTYLFFSLWANQNKPEPKACTSATDSAGNTTGTHCE
jgi:RHS repeat-associated protein